MTMESYLVIGTYTLYLGISIAMTIWVALKYGDKPTRLQKCIEFLSTNTKDH